MLYDIEINDEVFFHNNQFKQITHFNMWTSERYKIYFCDLHFQSRWNKASWENMAKKSLQKRSQSKGCER